MRQSGSRRDDPGPYLRFLFDCEEIALKRWRGLKVYLGNSSRKIEASREWILIEWKHDSTTMRSIEATQHKSVQKARACEMIHYQWEVKYTNGIGVTHRQNSSVVL
jgi:hypothetical protein